MSKPVKNMITDAYKHQFDGLSGAVLVSLSGVNSEETFDFRKQLGEKEIRVTVVKNALAKRAFEGTDLQGLGDYLSGPNALVYPVSEDSSVVQVARELIDWAKKVENLEFKGAVFEGITFGPDEIKKLSEYPTKEEAQAKAVQIILTPGSNLAGALVSPGKKLASIIKTIQEKLEAGEEIKKVG